MQLKKGHFLKPSLIEQTILLNNCQEVLMKLHICMTNYFRPCHLQKRSGVLQ